MTSFSDKLRQELNELVGTTLNSWQMWNRSDPESFRDSKELMVAETRRAIIKLVLDEVIGGDESHVKYMKNPSPTTDIPNVWGWARVIADRRNDLRAEQRKKLRGES